MIFLNKNFLFPLSHPIKTSKSKKQGNHGNKDDVSPEVFCRGRKSQNVFIVIRAGGAIELPLCIS